MAAKRPASIDLDADAPLLKKQKIEEKQPVDHSTTNGVAANGLVEVKTMNGTNSSAAVNDASVKKDDVNKAQEAKLETNDLPDEALALLNTVYHESEDTELAEDMIEGVYPYGSGEFRFVFRFPTGKKTTYEGFVLKYEEKWFLSPVVVAADVCEKALKEMKRYINEEWDLEDGGSKALDELCIEHVLWDFEHDEEGLKKTFPIVFRFQNSFLDQELYCGINPQTGEMDCCAR
jgi:hypothetical protein